MLEPIPFALGQLDRLMGFFPRNDGKATFLFTVDLGLLSLLALNFPYADPVSGLAVPAYLVIAAMIVSLTNLYRVFFPHLEVGATRSMMYFGDIAAESAGDYGQRLRTMTDEQLIDDLACQIHRNAEILAQKFRHVAIASMATGLAIFPWLAFLIATAILGGHLVWKS
ncbi:MAG: hypothetical protein JWL77_7146 [Chthonomonadaceae bacterium]|nr:hypothetical protein [Chthonomonadaceae bacterium]